MPHGCYIYSKASNMSKSKMCEYPQPYHSLSHWKCVLRCCKKFPCVNLPDQETYDQYSYTIPSISFHIYHIIARCTAHGRIPLNDKKVCRRYKQDSTSEKSTNIYTIKELVMLVTTISNFHTSFYIIEIQKLAFHLPYVQILDTSHCGDSSPNCV